MVTTISSKHRTGDFMRHALRLSVFALPEKTGRNGSMDISGIVSGVSIEEEHGAKKKDVMATVSVFNYDYAMQEVVLFSEGHRLAISMFDGYVARDFGDFVIVNPDRQYGESTSLNLRLRSDQIVNQLQPISYKFVNCTIAEAVADLWQSLGYQTDVTPTDETFPEVMLANETAVQFTKRWAEKLNYVWGIREGKFYFKKEEEVVVDHRTDPKNTLKFSPPFPEVGSIISARSQAKTDQARGGKPKIAGIDFSAGGFSSDIMNDLIAAGSVRTEEGRPIVTDPTKKPSFQATDVTRYKLLSMLRGPNFQGGEDSDSVLLPPYSLVPNVPGRVGLIQRSNDQASAMRDILFVQNAVNNYELQVVTWGNAALSVAGLVDVAGLSPEDNGTWFIKKIVHNFDSTYKQTLTLYRNEREAVAKRKKIKK
jgi:hypothetical protein